MSKMFVSSLFAINSRKHVRWPVCV